MDLYKNAVIAAQSVETNFFEYFHPYVKTMKILCGESLCPCGKLEQLHVAIEDDKINYHYYMNLHHGWHIACFNAGIDTETYCDYEKLTKLGDDYLIGKWN